MHVFANNHTPFSHTHLASYSRFPPFAQKKKKKQKKNQTWVRRSSMRRKASSRSPSATVTLRVRKARSLAHLASSAATSAACARSVSRCFVCASTSAWPTCLCAVGGAGRAGGVALKQKSQTIRSATATGNSTGRARGTHSSTHPPIHPPTCSARRSASPSRRDRPSATAVASARSSKAWMVARRPCSRA